MSFSEIRYSQVWEDEAILRGALNIMPNDVVLSITSGGCNALALLLMKPRRLICLDISPAQNALLSLKMAAIQHCSYQAYLAIMGVTAGERHEIYSELRPNLSLEARQFFDSHKADIDAGLIHIGRLERFMAGFRQDPLVSAITPYLRTLTGIKSLDAQRTVVSQIADENFKKVFKKYFSQENISRLGRDPAQFAFVVSTDVGEHFWQCFLRAMNETQFSTNFYMQYFLLGGYENLDYGPLLLRRESFDQLKRLCHRVELVTDSLENFSEDKRMLGITKVNLSNVFEYKSAASSQDLFFELSQRLPDNARMAFWNMLVDRAPQGIDSLVNLPPKANWRDRFCLYQSFKCYEVRR